MNPRGMRVVVICLLAACAAGFFWWRSAGRGGTEARAGAELPAALDADRSEEENAAAGSGVASSERRTPARPDAAETDGDTASPAEASEWLARVQVRFVDERGGPIPGVELELIEPGDAHARSSADGVAGLVLDPAWSAAPWSAARWSAARAAVMLTFEARGPGLAAERRTAAWNAGESGWLPEWTLVAGGSVAGRVLDERGLGLPGARIACLDESVSWASWGERRNVPLEEAWRPGAQAETELDGSFLLQAIPAGRVRLVAVAGDRPTAVSEPCDVPAGDVLRGVEIRMESAQSSTRISGTVVDPDGRPVPRAPISFFSHGSRTSTHCDERGRFERDLGRAATCDVTAFDPDRRYREASQRAVVAGTLDIVLELTRGPELELAVAAVSGEPIELFWVLVTSAQDERGLASFPEEQRLGGKLHLGVPAQEFRIEVHANGWLPGRFGPLRPEGAPARLECRLEPAHGVAGRVLAGGEPVGGAWVSLHAAVTTDMTHNGFFLHANPRASLATESDQDGRFSLSVEEAGDFYLRAQAGEFALAEVGPLALDPLALREQVVELGPGGAIAVTARSSTGRSGAGALVALSRGDGLARTHRVDPGGSLLVEHLTPGRWQVLLAEKEIDPRYGSTHFGQQERGEIPWNCEVFEGEVTRIDLWLEDRGQKDCRLHGRLVVDGQPATGWTAALFEGQEIREAPHPFIEPGALRVSAETPGSYRLFLTTDAVEPGQALIVLDPVELVQGDSFWSLELETGALEGSLTASRGRPDLIFHRWRRGDLQCLAPVLPDEQGRFRCPRVPAGRGSLARFDPNVPIEEQEPEILGEVDITAGKTSTIDL